MGLTEEERKSYDLAAEVSKQIITLSTAIITVSVALVGGKLERGSSFTIVASWIFFLAAIFFALWTLSALTGSINKSQKNIRAPNIGIPAFAQSLCFMIALVCAGLFGYKSMNKPPEKDKFEKIIIENKIINGKCNKYRVDTIIHERG